MLEFTTIEGETIGIHRGLCTNTDSGDNSADSNNIADTDSPADAAYADVPSNSNNNPTNANNPVVDGAGAGVQSMDITIVLASNHTYLTTMVSLFCPPEQKVLLIKD